MSGSSPSDDGSPDGRRGLVGSLLLRPVAQLDRVIAVIERVILSYAILLMFLNTIGNVIGRYIFGQSLYFSEELNQFLIVMVTFVGVGYATRRGRHIRMSAFYDQLKDKHRKILMVLIALGTGLVMFWLSWLAAQYVMSVAASAKVTPALRVPLYLTYLWVPFGLFLTGIQYMLTVVRNLTEPAVYISYEEVDAYEEIDTTTAGAGEDRS